MIGYVLIGIAIALVTAILVFQSYGYDLDRKTGSIIQNGLLFVAAQPEPANIYLNGKQYKSLSDARLVLPSDVYKLELQRDGYRSWARTLSLAGGTIERIVYPFLFPTDITSQEQKTYATAPTFTTQSPSRQWIIIQQPGQTGVFDQYDANDSKKAATTLTLPAGLLTASTQHTLKTIEWSTDNRHFLVQHDYAGGREFVMIDRENVAESYNVNKVLTVNPTEVVLRDKNFEQLYLYDQAAKKLDVANVKSKVVSPLLTNVLAFKSHGADLILYATNDKAVAGKTRIMIRDNSGSYPLRDITVSDKYLLNLAEYGGSWYMAAGAVNEGAVFIYKDPMATVKDADKLTLPETALRLPNPNWLEFSASTQFLALESGSQFAVYDFENERSFKYDLKVPLDTATPHATWMDGHRLLLSSQGKMVVVDYDGINQQTLITNQPGLLPMFDRQYKLMYTIAPRANNDGSFALNRTNLIVGQNN